MNFKDLKTHQNNRILLHACCGVCAAYISRALKEYFSEITLYFYNPNIYPESEYQKRLKAVRQVSFFNGLEIIHEEYNPRDWQKIVVGFEEEPEGGRRCVKCFEIRLRGTAGMAKNLGYQYFGTTLTVSPHKNAWMVNTIGKEVGDLYQIDFLEADFKKTDGFLKTARLAKKFKLYHQNYCGCNFSLNS